VVGGQRRRWMGGEEMRGREQVITKERKENAMMGLIA